MDISQELEVIAMRIRIAELEWKQDFLDLERLGLTLHSVKKSIVILISHVENEAKGR